MTSLNLTLTRRKFMLLSAVGFTAPLLISLSGLAAEAETPVETISVKKEIIEDANKKCKGCRMCTIFFSNCLAVNNRVCWCDPARSDRPVA